MRPRRAPILNRPSHHLRAEEQQRTGIELGTKKSGCRLYWTRSSTALALSSIWYCTLHQRKDPNIPLKSSTNCPAIYSPPSHTHPPTFVFCTCIVDFHSPPTHTTTADRIPLFFTEPNSNLSDSSVIEAEKRAQNKNERERAEQRRIGCASPPPHTTGRTERCRARTSLEDPRRIRPRPDPRWWWGGRRSEDPRRPLRSPSVGVRCSLCASQALIGSGDDARVGKEASGLLLRRRPELRLDRRGGCEDGPQPKAERGKALPSARSLRRQAAVLEPRRDKGDRGRRLGRVEEKVRRKEEEAVARANPRPDDARLL